jgi:diguanylate cyclase (GGDEF)-like protein/PAS domain S-box-containing protein
MSIDLTKFFSLSPDLLSVISLDGVFLRVNPAFCYSVGWEEPELVGKQLRDFIRPDEIQNFHSELDSLRANIPVLIIKFHFRCKDDQYKLIRWTAYPDIENGLLYAIAEETNSTSTNNEIFRMALEAAPMAIILTDTDGKITFVNSQAIRLFDYARDKLINKSIEILVPDKARRKHVGLRNHFAENPISRPMGENRDLLARRRDGAIFPAEIGLNPVQRDGKTYVICSISDLTDRKQAEEKILEFAERLEEENTSLSILAATDALTELQNRRSLLAILNKLLKRGTVDATPLSLVMLDIDHFKKFNDTYGHLAGDEILRTFSQLLKTRARHSDIVGRYGGEEFMLILPDTDHQGAIALAEEIRQTIEGYNWPYHKVTASLGIASTASQKDDKRSYAEISANLIEQADQALYHSKRTGRNRATHANQINTH